MGRLKDALHERTKFRTESRAIAQALVDAIVDKVDAAPKDQQGPILTMLQTELNQLLKLVGHEFSEKKGAG